MRNRMASCRTRFLAVCTLAVLCGSYASAQDASGSPYSAFGIGERVYPTQGRYSGMGGVGTGFSSYLSYNVLNPASLTDLSDVIFDMTGSARWSDFYNENERSPRLANGGIQGVSLALPTHKSLAFAFGISPYSQVAYEVNTLQTVQADSLSADFTNTRAGSGSLNDAYLSVAVKLFRKLNVGAKATYRFGSFNDVFAITSRTTTSAQTLTSYFLRDFVLTPGLQWRDTLTVKPLPDLSASLLDSLDSLSRVQLIQKHQRRIQRRIQRRKKLRPLYYTVGAALDYPIQGNSEGLVQRQTALDEDFRFLTSNDTLTNITGASFTYPTSFRMGASLETPRHLSFGVELQLTDWEEFDLQGRSENLGLEFRGAVGLEYVPDWRATRKVFKRMAYRAGAAVVQTPWEITVGDQTETIRGWEISGGLGIPVIQIKSRADFLSQINLGLTYGRYGPDQSPFLREERLLFTFGISFVQNWFQQFKYR